MVRARQGAGSAAHPRERDLIARWGAGAWRGWTLRASDGAAYTVRFHGRPGGSVGPDFRDAVLTDAAGERLTGDIELHLTPAGWSAHGHSSDARYNAVALHVTLTASQSAADQPCALASGRCAPLIVLAAQEPPATPAPLAWPCAHFAAAEGRLALLRSAGWARFEERVTALAEEMRRATAAGVAGWRPEDGALCAALAEGLAYGRDRAALRLCGERLARGQPSDALLTTAARLPVIERRRLDGLLALLDRWNWASPLATLCAALEIGAQRTGASGAAQALTAALRVAERGAISPGRARILAFNVALPAIVAWARSQPDDPASAALERLARAATGALPGLPSNQITREMTRQLGLRRLPDGALAQQGLHHIWSSACREKRCDICPCASPQEGAERLH
ncbi:MAG TPA: DUF2851 family protein [Ktedonobacterales bacterium]